MCRYTAGAGVGVFHSGVQVHGSEWAYGGHPYAFTGVFEITPRDERELGEQFRFRYVLILRLDNLQLPFMSAMLYLYDRLRSFLGKVGYATHWRAHKRPILKKPVAVAEIVYMASSS